MWPFYYEYWARGFFYSYYTRQISFRVMQLKSFHHQHISIAMSWGTKTTMVAARVALLLVCCACTADAHLRFANVRRCA